MRSAWHAWILSRVLMNEGYAKDEAIELALAEYPEARATYRRQKCEITKSTSSSVSADSLFRPLYGTQPARVAAVRSVWIGGANAD